MHTSAQHSGMWSRALTVVLVLMTAVMGPVPGIALGNGAVPIVQGTVTAASSSAPIVGAQVLVLFYDSEMADWATAGVTTTGADGGYVVYDDSMYGAGTYRVYVSASGYVDQFSEQSWTGAAPLAFSPALVAAQPLASGTITDAETESPIAGAQVTAEFYDSSSGRWLSAGYASSEADGGYSMYDRNAFGAGSYRFNVGAAGYVAQRIETTWNGGAPLVVNVALGHSLTLASGMVTQSGSGTPLVDAYVWAEYYEYDPVTETGEWLAAGNDRTDSNGVYAVLDSHEFGAGEYRVHVTASGHVYQMQPGTWDGSTPLEIDFELDQQTPFATGQVTAAGSGAPISGATMQAEFYDPSTEQWAFAGEATTGGDGAYSLGDYGHGAGEYLFTAWASGYYDTTQTVVWDGVGTLSVDGVLTLLGVDAYEPDNTRFEPGSVAVDGASQEHTLIPAGDHDWITFDVTTGVTYVVATTLAGRAPADTYLTLYAANGTTVLAENDDFDGPLSRIEWTAPGDQTVYAMVRHAEDGAGVGHYGLSVASFVVPPNQPPVAVADAYTVAQDGTLTRTAPGVLANDTDADGDSLEAATVAGPLHGSLSLNANGSFTYEPDSGYSGPDSFTYHANDGDLDSNTVTVTITVTPVDEEVSYIPIAGSNRYTTGVEASKAAFDSAGTVVIATGENWPDALGGAALSGVVDGPLLLTKPTALSTAVKDEIARLGASNAYILGGTGAVSPSVEAELNGLLAGTVTRLQGSNRYATARAVADRVIALQGASYTGEAFVSTGDNFPDALGASPLSAAWGVPILLTKTDQMPSLPGKVDSVTILGGTSVVTSKTEILLNAALGATDVDRIGGSNRYDTAAQVADYGVDGGMHWDGVGIATGLEFPDALSGGAMLGSMESVMLLTKSTSLVSQAEDRLDANKDDIDTVHFIGGTNAVSQGVRDKVAQVLE